MAGHKKHAAARARHGALAKPDEARVAKYFHNLMGYELRGGGVESYSARELACLELSQCEVALDNARVNYVRAQYLFESEEAESAYDILSDLLYFDWVEDDVKRKVMRNTFRIEKLVSQSIAQRKRLAGRYLREAQSRRDRAADYFLCYET